MSDLFDVGKETILITGASQGLGRQFARVRPRMAPRWCWPRVVIPGRDKVASFDAQLHTRKSITTIVSMDSLMCNCTS
jgi:short-subunit dehydrogenase